MLTLSLDRTPAAELLGETAITWADALWAGRAWHDSDDARIAEAFRRLSGAQRQWPAPADFLAALPPRTPSSLRSLPARTPTAAECDAVLRRLEKMAREVGIA